MRHFCQEFCQTEAQLNHQPQKITSVTCPSITRALFFDDSDIAIICRETSLTNGKSKDHSPITTSFLSRFLSYQCLFCTDGAGLNDDPISTSTTGQTLNMIFPVEALSPANGIE